MNRIRDLADTVSGNVILSKFAALVQAANLGTFLSSRGPFTLFVPTNSAFSKLPPGMFEDLLLPENQAQVQRIVLFHLISGQTLTAKDLIPLKSVISCEGTALPLKTTKAGTHFVMLEDKSAARPGAHLQARVTHADIHCANGLMHEVDTLLLPPQVVLVSKPAASPATGNDPATNSAPPTDAVPTSATTNAPPQD